MNPPLSTAAPARIREAKKVTGRTMITCLTIVLNKFITSVPILVVTCAVPWRCTKSDENAGVGRSVLSMLCSVGSQVFAVTRARGRTK